MQSWVWWAGGGLGAIVVFFIVSRLFGWKIGAVAAGAVAAFAAYRSQIAKAIETGRAFEEERQRQVDETIRQQAEEARRRARERNLETGGAIDENDPHLRD